MSIKILTDSAADILPSEAEELGITVIPLIVTINGQDYKDVVEMSHDEYYKILPTCKELPTTSQISPSTYEDYFGPMVEAGDTVIAITLSSRVSGTYQSACIAAEEYDGKVLVVDSMNATVGQRVIVYRAVELLKEGKSAEEIVEILNKEKDHVRLLAVIDTLEYLKKSGRISATTAFVGGVLNIKPVVAIVDGQVVMVGKARGSKNGSNLLRKMIEEGPGVDFNKPYVIGYSGSSDRMLVDYVEDNADLWKTQIKEIPRCRVGAVIGTHVGPDGIAVAFFENM